MSSEGAKAFIARWAAASASERANSQPFLCELCDILGVARPEPTRETGYAFEYEVTEHHPDGSTTKGRIDLYKRACFVLESKQFQEAKAAASQLELAAQEAGVIEKKKSSLLWIIPFSDATPMKCRRTVGSWILILVIASAIANPPTGSYAAALKLGAMGDRLTHSTA
jgi:hypothetical protein